MSDWSDAIEDLNAAAVSVDAFGESCTLPSGDTLGVFHPRGDPSEPWGSEVGLAMRMSQQSSPLLVLRDADAQGLEDGDPVTVRGSAYLVTRVDPAYHGLTQVYLMRDLSDTASPPETERWR